MLKIFNNLFSTKHISPSQTKIEMDFLEHQRSFKPSLDAITQTGQQHIATLTKNLESLEGSGKPLSDRIFTNSKDSKGLLELVTIPADDPQSELAAKTFLKKVLTIGEDIKLEEPIKTFARYQRTLKDQNATLEGMADAQGCANVVLTNHPQREQISETFAASLDVSSLGSLDLIIKYSELSESLTYFCVSQKVLLALGIQVFISSYGAVRATGCLTEFLTATYQKLYIKLPPAPSVYVYKYVTEYRYAWMGTGSLLLFGFSWRYGLPFSDFFTIGDVKPTIAVIKDLKPSK